jgi:hypothetical protein
MGLSRIILMLHARTITGSLMSALENCLRDAPIEDSLQLPADQIIFQRADLAAQTGGYETAARQPRGEQYGDRHVDQGVWAARQDVYLHR